MLTETDLILLIDTCKSEPWVMNVTKIPEQVSIKRLASFGLIEFKDGQYIQTKRGRAHIKNLCSKPLPEQAWIDENGVVIDL